MVNMLDKPFVKELEYEEFSSTKPIPGFDLTPELNSCSGLSKNKQDHINELLEGTAPSKEYNSPITYPLHEINYNLNSEETNVESYLDRNWDEIPSDAYSTDYDAPDNQDINSAHPNSNLSENINPLIGQQGNTDIPLTNFNYNFDNSIYYNTQVNTGQTDF